MLPLKEDNIIVYSDGVNKKFWHSQGDIFHPIMLQKSQDVTRSPFAQAERSQSATCALLHCPNALKLCPKQCWRQSLTHLGNVGAHMWHSGSVQHWANGERVTSWDFCNKIIYTMFPVTVTIYHLYHLNRLLCYHILKVICFFG